MGRRIKSIDLVDIALAEIPPQRPNIVWVSPNDLLINDAYQREISEKGYRLINKIITEFSWAKFKIPNVVETEEGLEVIDGQHTAVACISHPDITEIPVIVVSAAGVIDRADAFIGINKDRMQVNSMQLHHASAAKGDKIAHAVNLLCADTGVTILRSQRHRKAYGVGETIAVKQISNILSEHGIEHTTRVLRICRNAELAPIAATYLRAVSAILLDQEKMLKIDEQQLTLTISRTCNLIDKEVKTWAAEHGVSNWRALEGCLFRATLKGSAQSPKAKLVA